MLLYCTLFEKTHSVIKKKHLNKLKMELEVFATQIMSVDLF